MFSYCSMQGDSHERTVLVRCIKRRIEDSYSYLEETLFL